MLSIYYLWHTENNSAVPVELLPIVVICFQSIIFDILKTTCNRFSAGYEPLWFAFNLLSLTYWKQQPSIILLIHSRCDLLSIYYLWHTENNMNDKLLCIGIVVICFQSIIFDILKTTKIGTYATESALWFAFNLLSLTYWKQLGKKYLFVPSVVICFQSIIFDILKTTEKEDGNGKKVLWFAFNLLSLTYWKQHKD